MRTTGKMVGDFVEVLDFDAGVPALFGIDNNIGALLACSEAHVGLHFYILESLCSYSFLQLSHELLGASGFTVNILTDETGPHLRSLLNSYGSVRRNEQGYQPIAQFI